MAKRWMQKAFAGATGQLRKKLGIKKGQSMSLSQAEAAGAKPGRTGRQGRLAATAIKIARKRNRRTKKV